MQIEFTEQQIESIYSGFKNKTLSKVEWTHKAHLIVAACFLLDFSLEKTVPLIREGIKEYNVASGGVNTDLDGYHETITMFWVIKINEFLSNYHDKSDREKIINEMLAGDFVQRNLPFNYYSEVPLCSTMARHNWIIPDLQELKIPEEMGLVAVKW